MIELYKFWSEYTDEEKRQLPPLNLDKMNESNHYIWNGEFWEYIPF